MFYKCFGVYLSPFKKALCRGTKNEGFRVGFGINILAELNLFEKNFINLK
jgi:hypothetical protein